MTCFLRPIRYLAFLFFLIRFFQQPCVDAVTLSQPNSPLTNNALLNSGQKQRFQRLPFDPVLAPSISSPDQTTEPSTPKSSNEFGTQRRNPWHEKGIVPPRQSQQNAAFSATGDSNDNSTVGPHPPMNPYGGFGDNGKMAKQTKNFPPRMTSAPESENDASAALPKHSREEQGQTRHRHPHLMPNRTNRVSGQVLIQMKQEQPETAFPRDRPPYPPPFRMPQEGLGKPLTSVRGVQQAVTPDSIPVIPVFPERFPADSNLLGMPEQTSRQPSAYAPPLMGQPLTNRDANWNQKNDLSGPGLPRHLSRPPPEPRASKGRGKSKNKRSKRSKRRAGRRADRASEFPHTSTADFLPLSDVQQQMPFQAEQYVRTSPALWDKFNEGGPGQEILAKTALEKQQDFGKKFTETQQRYSEKKTPKEKKSKKKNKRKRDKKQKFRDLQKKRDTAPPENAQEPNMLRGNVELEGLPNPGMSLSNAFGGNNEQPFENAPFLPGRNRFLASQGGVSVGGAPHSTDLFERENSRISNHRFPQPPSSASQGVSLLEISSLNSNPSTSSENTSLKESPNDAAQPGLSSMNNGVEAELGTAIPPPPRFEKFPKQTDTSDRKKPLVLNATRPLAPEVTTPSTPETAKPLAVENTEPQAAQLNSKQPDQALNVPPMIRDKVQSQPTMGSQSKNATAPIKKDKNVKDIAVQLRKALTKKRKLSQQKAEAEEGRKEQEKNLEEHKKRLREKEAGAVEKMRTYETLLSEVEELAKVADTAFVKVANFSLPNETDVPRALPVEKGVSGEFDCPIHCDPTICTEPPSDLTQCFQTVDKDQTTTASSGEKQHVCAPFANPDTLDCSPGYVPCSQATPQENAEFKVPVSTLQKPEYTNITINGYNMHQCLRLIVLPPTENCDAKNVANMMMATGPIMGYGGNAVYPTVTQDGHTAQFNQIQLLQEGTFQLCIVQFGKKPASARPVASPSKAAKSPMEAAASFQNEGIVVLHATIAGNIKGLKPGQTASQTVKPSTSSSVAATNVTSTTLSKNNAPLLALAKKL